MPQGSGWYRKRFTLPSFFKGQSIWLEFDGYIGIACNISDFFSIYRNSNAYLNGVFLGNHQSGYTSFRYDITNVPGVVYGDDNVLAVHVDATHSEGWWYEGKSVSFPFLLMPSFSNPFLVNGCNCNSSKAAAFTATCGSSSPIPSTSHPGVSTRRRW